MFRSLKRHVAPVVLRSLTAFLARWNYEVRRRPKAVMPPNDGELTMSLEFVLAHHLLKNENLTFLQIGAYDGLQADPLYRFIKRFHWRGVLVEPMPDAFAKLQETYRGESQLQLLNVAIDSVDGSRPLYHLRRDASGLPTWAPMVASFDREVLMRHGPQISGISDLIQSTEVACCSFETILERTGLSQIDLVQIDAEGWDYEILKLIDFERVRPRIVNYEHAHLKADDWEAAVNLLAAHGYRTSIGKYDTVAYLSECMRQE